MLHNEKVRDVIDTVGKKGVLFLGRFTEDRMEVLERLREKLRSLGFVPMVFNFDKPETKDFSETVWLLANLSHFVILDITKPRSVPHELAATVPDYMVPFAPILQEGATVRNVHGPSEKIQLGARCNRLYLRRPPDTGFGGRDRQARRGEV